MTNLDVAFLIALGVTYVIGIAHGYYDRVVTIGLVPWFTKRALTFGEFEVRRKKLGLDVEEAVDKLGDEKCWELCWRAHVPIDLLAGCLLLVLAELTSSMYILIVATAVTAYYAAGKGQMRGVALRESKNDPQAP